MREAVETRLDELVRENRFTIAVLFPAVGAVTLVASEMGWLPPALAFNPLLLLTGVLVMRLPLVAGLLPLTDRRATAALAALFAYTYGVEWVGVHRGVPYGEFAYGVELGPMIAGVPAALPLFFVPLVVDAYLLCLLLLGERARSPWLRVPAVVATVVAMDLVLDPGAAALGLWDYEAAGVYYGVPLSNFAGWVLSATVATALLDVAYDWRALVDRLGDCEFMLDDLVSFVVLWGAVNAVYGQWIAAGVAAAFGLGLLRTERFDFAVWRSAPGT